METKQEESACVAVFVFSGVCFFFFAKRFLYAGMLWCRFRRSTKRARSIITLFFVVRLRIGAVLDTKNGPTTK